MDELTNALKVIQKECNKHSWCCECPMGTDSGMCCVKEYQPTYWEIIEHKEIPRVMKEW